MTARILLALSIVSTFWACGGDSVTTSEPPSLERGLHEVGNLTQPRYQHVATLLPDGKVLIAGGYKEGRTNFTDVSNRHISAEIFDPVTGISSPTGNMTVGRNTDHGVLLSDGRVLIMPRYHDFPVEIYDPHSARFESLAKIPWYPPISTVNLLQSGKVFVTTQAHSAVFGPAAGAFLSIVAMENTRINHSATLLKDGRVLIVGGSMGKNELTGRNLIYDPSSSAFTEAGHLQVDRSGHTAVFLKDGRVLIVERPYLFRACKPCRDVRPRYKHVLAGRSVCNLACWLPCCCRQAEYSSSMCLTGNIVLYNPATRTFSPTGHSIGPWREQRDGHAP